MQGLEIIMDIESLEVFEVIDHDSEEIVSENSDATKHTPSECDDLNRIRLENGHYYKPASILWEGTSENVMHQLAPENKHGNYPYHKRARDGTWGYVYQLSQEEALWLTLEFNPDLMA
ncbi:TPA: hypothetical protein ACG5IH_001132 [Streptococcus agalactiae]